MPVTLVKDMSWASDNQKLFIDRMAQRGVFLGEYTDPHRPNDDSILVYNRRALKGALGLPIEEGDELAAMTWIPLVEAIQYSLHETQIEADNVTIAWSPGDNLLRVGSPGEWSAKYVRCFGVGDSEWYNLVDDDERFHYLIHVAILAASDGIEVGTIYHVLDAIPAWKARSHKIKARKRKKC